MAFVRDEFLRYVPVSVRMERMLYLGKQAEHSDCLGRFIVMGGSTRQFFPWHPKRRRGYLRSSLYVETRHT